VKRKPSSLWLIPAISAMGFSSTASAIEFGLMCNESVSEGKNCGAEVKCYSEDIIGGAEFFIDSGEYYEGAVQYNFFNTDADEPICGGLAYINLEQTPKVELKCTENAKGKDEEGDIAVEVELNLAGCPVD